MPYGLTLGVSLLVAASAFGQPVTIDTGVVDGTVEEGLRIYRGIPLRCAAGRRPPVAAAAARGEMGRVRAATEYWPRVRADEPGDREAAGAVGRLPLRQRVDAGHLVPASGCR